MWNEKEFYLTGELAVASIISKYCDILKIKLDDNIKFEKVLDFGCGIGRLSLPLSKYFLVLLALMLQKK